VKMGDRRLRVDLAWSGALYAVLDSEATGIPLTPARLHEVRRIGMDLSRALEGIAQPSTPEGAVAFGGVVITGPPESPDAHLRVVTVTPEGVCDRSGLSGAPAVAALLHGMGLASQGDTVACEGIHGLPFAVDVARTVARDDGPAVDTRVWASAWMTGDATLVVDDDDPLTFDG
jgi:proline racemase